MTPYLPLIGAALAFTAAAEPFRVGAARVDITPAADASLPMGGYGSRKQGFRAIHDNIYVRAIVIDDGTTQAALVAWELLFVPDAVWQETSKRVAAETGIQSENLLLCAVHDHGAPTPNLASDAPQSAAYTRTVEQAAVEAIRLAKAKLQPARFGIGIGTAYVNINRREAYPDRGLWLGYNQEGPSDKTVTVLRFDNLSGKPIAFWINYPVHAVVMGPENLLVTGDLAGATSRFVEQHFARKDHPRSDAGPRLRLRSEDQADADVVAVWTSGAAGDQNPVSMVNGEDFRMVDALGQILGEAVVRSASGVTTSADVRIRSVQQVVTCPGRRVEPGPTPRSEYRFDDTDAVSIRLGLIILNDVAVAGVSGEVFTLIAQRLKRESPIRHTIMVTHANGSSGYIPNDAAFEPVSYEVTASRLKPGCAEGAIVGGFLKMMQR
jgi:hypothetical protein